jgi:uncharacterized membrane protein YphA (DoxX/SURF4 family)
MNENERPPFSCGLLLHTGPFADILEILRGTLLIVGLCTVLATIPVLLDILAAIATTKLVFSGSKGFWATMHDGRTDFCMLLGLIATALLGAGSLSVNGRRRNA